MSGDSETGRRWHDLGGTEAGPVEPHEHDHALWEKRVDALRAIANERGFFTVDGLRRARILAVRDPFPGVPRDDALPETGPEATGYIYAGFQRPPAPAQPSRSGRRCARALVRAGSRRSRKGMPR